MTDYNNTWTITCTSTYYGGTGTLNLYTTDLTPSRYSEIPIEFGMTQLDPFAITGNLHALRNARDQAEEQRDFLIAEANSSSNLRYLRN